MDINTLEEGAEKKQKPKKTVGQEIKEWILSLAVALVIVLLCQNFLFTLITVDGHSMDTTLADGEKLFVSVLDVKLQGGVNRNDVVICKYPGRTTTWLGFIKRPTYFVKRAVAVPGDTVYRKQGVTYVTYEENGETVTESLDGAYVLYYDPAGDYEPYMLGENEYFVVGDNRGNSHDSRDWNDSNPEGDVGPITNDMLVGRVRCIIWPLSSLGGIPERGA